MTKSTWVTIMLTNNKGENPQQVTIEVAAIKSVHCNTADGCWILWRDLGMKAWMITPESYAMLVTHLTGSKVEVP